MKPVRVTVVLMMALTASAAAAERVKIAFVVPPSIERFVSRITFENIERVKTSDRPAYTIYAEIAASGDNGLLVRAWVNPGMTVDTAELSERCDLDDCKRMPPPPQRVWEAFTEAFNRVLIRNPDGFGHYKPTECVGTTLKYAELKLESKLIPDLTWPRYRMARIHKPEASYLSYHLTRYVSTTSVGRFEPNNKTADLRNHALKHIKNLCGKKELEEVRFIPQYGAQRPRSQTTAENAESLRQGSDSK